MGKLLKIVALIVLVLIVSKFVPNNMSFNTGGNTSPISASPRATSGGQMTVPAEYYKNFAKLSPELVQYVKGSAMFGASYNANKKFIIYFTGANCPYAQSFVSAVSTAASDPSIQQYYSFLPIDVNQGGQTFVSSEEAQKDVEFNNTCHEFCIVNPVRGELFFFDGVGEEEGAKLPTVIEGLKAW